jgi:hypothetical protein
MYSARYSCQILMNLESSQQIFEKSLNIKFNENPFSGSRGVACRRSDVKLTVVFRNFANAPKNMLDCNWGNLQFKITRW